MPLVGRGQPSHPRLAALQSNDSVGLSLPLTPIQVPSVSHGEVLILWAAPILGQACGERRPPDLVADGRGPSSSLEWPQSQGKAAGSHEGLPRPRDV